MLTLRELDRLDLIGVEIFHQGHESSERKLSQLANEMVLAIDSPFEFISLFTLGSNLSHSLFKTSAPC